MVTRLGVDPGETTGLAVFVGEHCMRSFEVPNGVAGMKVWLQEHLVPGVFDEVIVENFVVEPGFVGVPVASEIIGMIRYACDGPIITQQRSDKTNLFHQKKKGEAGEAERFAWLEARGFQRIGKGHNLDAVTHVLVRLRRLRDMDAWSRYWARPART